MTVNEAMERNIERLLARNPRRMSPEARLVAEFTRKKREVSMAIRTGNVIRGPESASLWIVSAIRGSVMDLVSFDSENCSATVNLQDHSYQSMCVCEGQKDYGCEECDGSGFVTMPHKGWSNSTVVARSVNELLLRGYKNLFGLP